MSSPAPVSGGDGSGAAPSGAAGRAARCDAVLPAASSLPLSGSPLRCPTLPCSSSRPLSPAGSGTLNLIVCLRPRCSKRSDEQNLLSERTVWSYFLQIALALQ